MATSTASKRRRSRDRWTNLLIQHLPSLSRPQAKVLALFSIGIVLARSSKRFLVHIIACSMLGCASGMREKAIF